MAAGRAVLIVLGLAGFFCVGLPLQWLVAAYAPGAAHRIPRLFCRSLLRLARVRVAVDGSARSGEPVLLAANHVSWIDILALGAIAPFCFLAKSELGSWPLLSSFAAVGGTVFVDRKRRRTIPRANALMASRMRDGRPVLMFPEGTTTAGPLPGRFRSSHFAAARDLLAGAGAPPRVLVQPVALAYSSAVAAWVGDEDLVSHLWRVLRAPPLRCTVRFGEPVAFEPGRDRKAAAGAAEAAVGALLGAHLDADLGAHLAAPVAAGPPTAAARPASGAAAATGMEAT